MTDTDPVIVGVDGSDDSLRAARWAANLAMRNGRELVVLHAWEPFRYRPLGPGDQEYAQVHEHASQILREGVDAAGEHWPMLNVTGRLATASPTIALRAHSESASVVVIGAHGNGALGSFLLGSVGVDLAGHTLCPLAVVRGTVHPSGPVVVGVDDSPRTQEVLEFAFHEAWARSAPLHAIHSWATPVAVSDWPHDEAQLMHDAEKHAKELLEALVEPFRSRYPDVHVECLATSGSPRHNLVGASLGAQVVVVGTRGRGGFSGLVLGSTSHSLIHHASCPVVIVPHLRDLEGRPANEDEDVDGMTRDV